MGSVLDSDHVNYLIWRYLQERGYGYAAVQLAREWGLIDPQKLPFAGAVKPYTLISILQDGLSYDEIANSVRGSRNGTSQQMEFGEEPPSSSRKYAFINSKKRSATSEEYDEIYCPPLKRHRQSANGSRAVVDVTERTGKSITGTDRMEVDQPDAQNDREEAIEIEPEPPEPEPLPTTLEIGESVGLQIIPDPPPEPLKGKTVANVQIHGADIIYLNWDQVDSSRLFIHGGSVWRCLTIPLQDDSKDSVAEPLMDDFGPRQEPYFVTAFAQAKTSEQIAIALEREASEDPKNSLLLRTPNFSFPLTATAGTFTSLRWNPADKTLISTSILNEATELQVWNIEDCNVLANRDIAKPVLDVAWVTDTSLIVCGEQFLSLYQTEPALELSKSIDTGATWEKLRFDRVTNKVACISPDNSEIAIIGVLDFDLQTKSAHEGDITSIEWQPLPSGVLAEESPRLLATSSTDGTLKLWNARGTLECVRTFELGHNVPAMALAFSPSGSHVAIAGDGRIHVWRTDAEETDIPTVTWQHPELDAENQAQGKKADGVEMNADEVPIHNLCWNSSRSLLAYAQGDKIVVIELPKLEDSIEANGDSVMAEAVQSALEASVAEKEPLEDTKMDVDTAESETLAPEPVEEPRPATSNVDADPKPLEVPATTGEAT